MTRQSRLHMSLAQRIVLAGLLLCMALAQGLSLAHRTLHQDAHTLEHVHGEQSSRQHVDGHAHGADCDEGAFSRLFASHEKGDETCRVIDGSTAFLKDFSPLAGVLPALYAPVLVASIAHALAAWQAPLFEARGPPVHSL